MFLGLRPYEQAKPYYEDALAIYKKMFGDNHPDTAASLNNLGQLLYNQGKYVEATIYLEQALTVYETALGGKNR